jgi:phage gpG-like protein
MKLSIELTGAPALLMQLQEKVTDTDFVLYQVIAKGALDIEREAKELCPVDSGRLRSSITHEILADSAKVGTNVEYAPYVEFGTGRANSYYPAEALPFKKSKIVPGMKSKPYLFPAFRNNVDKINASIDSVIKRNFK